MTETRKVILSYAENRASFRFSNLLSYINSINGISKVTLSWYLREMVKDNSLSKLGRGIYTSRHIHTRGYVPRLSDKTLKVAKKLAEAFPFITVCAFDGCVLADFQHHMSSNNLRYIEVDRDAMDNVFHFLKSKGYTAYLNPDKDFVYENIDLSGDAFVVKPLISESPLTEIHNVKTPRLEKILVDILCDDDMDYLHGSEWNHIFDNAHAMYSISQTAMLRYASRRNAKAPIQKAIENLETDND